MSKHTRSILFLPVMPPVSNGQQTQIESSSPVIQPAGIANVLGCRQNPFYCKLLAGNIRVCHGCRGSLRTTDGGVPPSPYNLVIARAERCTFRNTSGELITPHRETICHYHCKLDCIRAAEQSFVPSSLSIPILTFVSDLITFMLSIYNKHLVFSSMQ